MFFPFPQSFSQFYGHLSANVATFQRKIRALLVLKTHQLSMFVCVGEVAKIILTPNSDETLQHGAVEKSFSGIATKTPNEEVLTFLAAPATH